MADPNGYIFLAHAFDVFGTAIFDNWSGCEVEDAGKTAPRRIPPASEAYVNGEPHWGIHKEFGPSIGGMATGFSAEQPIPMELWRAVTDHNNRERSKIQEARARRDVVVSEMWECARSGDLVFASRPKGGGSALTVIQSSEWEVDYPWVPFATLGYDRDRGLASTDPTDWLFVSAHSIGRVLGIGDQPPKSEADSGLSDGPVNIAEKANLRQRILTKASAECWYKQRIAAAELSGIRFSRENDEQAGRLLGLGRDRVRGLRVNFAPPEWRAPGRPSKTGK